MSDRVMKYRVVLPSSPIKDEGGEHTTESLQDGIGVLKSFGVMPWSDVDVNGDAVLGDDRRKAETEFGVLSFFAGDDVTRQRELRTHRGDESGRGMLLLACAKGGYGAARVLEHQEQHEQDEQEDKIRTVLLGFSDVTALLLSRYAHGIRGDIHGPCLTLLNKEPAWSKDRLRLLLSGEATALPPIQGETWIYNNASETASGPLVAANLAVASALIGTRHFPDLTGCILILEDVTESPQRIDRCLTHWRLAGHLHRVAGIGFGEWQDCGDKIILQRVLKERTADLGVIIIGNLPIGHHCGDGIKANAALPLGWHAQLDASSGRLVVSKPILPT